MTDYRQIQRLVIIILKDNNKSIIRLCDRASSKSGKNDRPIQAGKMGTSQITPVLGSKIVGSAQLRKHGQENKVGGNWRKEGQRK